MVYDSRQEEYVDYGHKSSAFATLLRKHREAARLSHAGLSERLKCDHSYISRLETGSRLPSREFVERLVHGLDLSPSERTELYDSTQAGIVDNPVGDNYRRIASAAYSVGMNARDLPVAMADAIIAMIEASGYATAPLPIYDDPVAD